MTLYRFAPIKKVTGISTVTILPIREGVGLQAEPPSTVRFTGALLLGRSSQCKGLRPYFWFVPSLPVLHTSCRWEISSPTRFISTTVRHY